MKAEKARQKLEALITIRGNIAHRARHDKLLRRPEIDGYMNFIFHLAIQSHNAVVKHLIALVGASPWRAVKCRPFDPPVASDRVTGWKQAKR